MKKDINILIDEIVSNVKDEWPVLYKIRYVYLAVGKELMRDTDFFLSVDGKLGSANLSNQEIIDIYNSDKGRGLAVICKSASSILKMAYDRLGIRSKLIETNTSLATIYDSREFLINHWFLAVYDDKGKAYFMTLTPDLGYIQMNMETRHFASNIPYIRDFGSKKMQVYKGEEIKPSSISRDELQKIDIEIGYIKRKYLYNDKYQRENSWNYHYDNASFSMLKNEMHDNKLFYELAMKKSPLYKKYATFKGENNKAISFFEDDLNDLTIEDWKCFSKVICEQVLDKIKQILGYEIFIIPDINSKHWNYESWVLNLCVQLQNEILKRMIPKNKEDTNIDIDLNQFEYNKWTKSIKKKYFSRNTYDDILSILDKMNVLISSTKKGETRKNVGGLLSRLEYHFIPEEYIYEENINKDGYISNHYIANKFNFLFPYVFSCNDTITDFNKMGYSEQLSIMKEILMIMFPEINKNNSSMLNYYNKNYNAVFNRIQMYTVINKETCEYSIVFNIPSNKDEDDYYFFYNPGKNLFKEVNFLDLLNDYIIVSNRLKNKMSIMNLENIEKKGKKF